MHWTTRPRHSVCSCVVTMSYHGWVVYSLWVRILAVITSLSKTLYFTCCSSHMSINGYLWGQRWLLCLISPVAPNKVAHNGSFTPQGAEKDYRNDIGPVTRGNNVKRIETLCENALYKNIIYCLYYNSPHGNMTGMTATRYKSLLWNLVIIFQAVEADVLSVESMKPHFIDCDAVFSCLGTNSGLMKSTTFYSDSMKAITEAMRATE